jgi:DNA-binding NtrC family response regulator
VALQGKRILIVDESGFSRVCSALLEFEGYGAKTVTCVEDLDNWLDDYGLIITSYPYGSFLFSELGKMEIPVIILSDHINRDLITVLEGFKNSYCMIKPLDYQKFRSLVRQVMCGASEAVRGYNIV